MEPSDRPEGDEAVQSPGRSTVWAVMSYAPDENAGTGFPPSKDAWLCGVFLDRRSADLHATLARNLYGEWKLAYDLWVEKGGSINGPPPDLGFEEVHVLELETNTWGVYRP